MKPWLLAVFLSTAAAMGAETEPAPSPSGKPKALFDRLGGKKGSRCIADAFVDALASDAKLLRNPNFKKIESSANKLQVKTRLSEVICKATGGPCKPSNKPLVPGAPARVEVSPVEWFYVVQDANAAMDRCKVGSAEKLELISLLMKARKS